MMRKQFAGAALVVAMMCAGIGSGVAANEQSIPEMLFERKHLESIAPGSTLVYRFQRTVSEPKLLGEPFSDDIKLSVTKIAEDGTREVEVKVFSGDRARDPRSIDGMTGNPVLAFYLDRAIANFNLLGGGNKAYLKNQFRIALRTTAKRQPVKVTYEGKEVDGFRVTLVPYANDANRDKMQGYENARFDVVVSEAVPGEFVEFSSVFESSLPGSPRLEERIALSGTGEIK